MTTPNPNGNRRSWDYPPCPECGSDVLVENLPAAGGYNDPYYCWACELRFTPDE